MVQVILFVVIQWVRARADETHLSLENVPKLREFVEAVFAHEFPGPGDTRIVMNLKEGPLALVAMAQRFFQFIRVCHHRTQLVALEYASLLTHTAGGVKNGTR